MMHAKSDLRQLCERARNDGFDTVRAEIVAVLGATLEDYEAGDIEAQELHDRFAVFNVPELNEDDPLHNIVYTIVFEVDPPVPYRQPPEQTVKELRGEIDEFRENTK